MKTIIFVLIIVSFIQATIIPLDLVLIILICRSYIRSDRTNLYLAFAFGLFDAHLNSHLLGLTSLVYMIMVLATESLSKSRLSSNSLFIIPLTLILLGISHAVFSFSTHSSLQLFPKVIIESILSLPILYILRLWEERFIVRREIRLKF